jgi:hypothetical protein
MDSREYVVGNFAALDGINRLGEQNADPFNASHRSIHDSAQIEIEEAVNKTQLLKRQARSTEERLKHAQSFNQSIIDGEKKRPGSSLFPGTDHVSYQASSSPTKSPGKTGPPVRRGGTSMESSLASGVNKVPSYMNSTTTSQAKSSKRRV